MTSAAGGGRGTHTHTQPHEHHQQQEGSKLSVGSDNRCEKEARERDTWKPFRESRAAREKTNPQAHACARAHSPPDETQLAGKGNSPSSVTQEQRCYISSGTVPGWEGGGGGGGGFWCETHELDRRASTAHPSFPLNPNQRNTRCPVPSPDVQAPTAALPEPVP